MLILKVGLYMNNGITNGMNNNKQFQQMDKYYNNKLNAIRTAYMNLSEIEKEKFLNKVRTELDQRAVDDFLSRL